MHITLLRTEALSAKTQPLLHAAAWLTPRSATLWFHWLLGDAVWQIRRYRKTVVIPYLSSSIQPCSKVTARAFLGAMTTRAKKTGYALFLITVWQKSMACLSFPETEMALLCTRPLIFCYEAMVQFFYFTASLIHCVFKESRFIKDSRKFSCWCVLLISLCSKRVSPAVFPGSSAAVVVVTCALQPRTAVHF